jgi:hypothetical protein
MRAPPAGSPRTTRIALCGISGVQQELDQHLIGCVLLGEVKVRHGAANARGSLCGEALGSRRDSSWKGAAGTTPSCGGMFRGRSCDVWGADTGSMRLAAYRVAPRLAGAPACVGLGCWIAGWRATRFGRWQAGRGVKGYCIRRLAAAAFMGRGKHRPAGHFSPRTLDTFHLALRTDLAAGLPPTSLARGRMQMI